MELDNKAALQKLRDEMNKALAPVAEKLGLTKLQARNISYEPSGLACRIQVIAETQSADGKTKEEVAFEQNADLFDLKPEWLHKRIQHGRDELEIIGLCPNRRKFPVLVRNCQTDKRVLVTVEEVKRKLNSPMFAVKPEQSKLELVPPPARTGIVNIEGDTSDAFNAKFKKALGKTVKGGSDVDSDS